MHRGVSGVVSPFVYPLASRLAGVIFRTAESTAYTFCQVGVPVPRNCNNYLYKFIKRYPILRIAP
jgi:hypothetical protein